MFFAVAFLIPGVIVDGDEINEKIIRFIISFPVWCVVGTIGKSERGYEFEKFMAEKEEKKNLFNLILILKGN